ncbi:hypothetical protein ARAM_006071 [Aspergillus rambellii]|uniref:3-hydroxyacyl-CoA dehydrogenase n=1 Tax=Aspergillus rambellii TaxID=308745 RepID=A0A0F8UY55_9EURO|nr:hypothetical protein ARAM_006071 [Aspergillus rambellii]
MARFDPEPFLLYGLRGKVIVLTGGANGIGAATVDLLYENGALVVFGDLDADAGKKVEARYPERVQFVSTDVSIYSSLLNLFHAAYAKYHRVDHAFSIAGVSEQSSWFHPSLDLNSLENVPEPIVLKVDLLGPIYFSRIAAGFLRQRTSTDGNEGGTAEKKSLVLVSSVAGFMESPGLPIYCAAKHGVLGLMRSLRCSLPQTHGISVSAVCPWMSATSMVDDIEGPWQRAGLPVNQPAEVAQIIVGLAALGEEGNGKSIYVEGGRGWDIETGLEQTRNQWMGQKQSEAWLEGEKFLRSHPASAAYWLGQNGIQGSTAEEKSDQG